MNSKIDVKSLNIFYDNYQALHDINLSIKENEVVAIIGPSGCGKSTFLRCLNRMNDYTDGFRINGSIKLDGKDIYDIERTNLCTKVGMVFQKPVPFPKSIYENVSYGPMIHDLYSSKEELDYIVEDSLRKASLYDEVKDSLHKSALELSGGQQQRLCIARAIAIKPEVILMDEPCASLDPISTAKMEDLIDELKKKFTIVVITHSMQQAARISTKTAFFNMGYLVEYDCTEKIFTSPKNKQTQDYITGRFG